MTLSCRLDLPSDAIARHFGTDAGPDPWGGGAIQPGQFAPVIVRSGATGQKVIRPMHWGYPSPGQSTEAALPGTMRWVSHVRNLESPFWIGNLRLVLDAVLTSGKQHTSGHAKAPLKRLLDELGPRKPALVRGDCGYGNRRSNSRLSAPTPDSSRCSTISW